MENVNEKCVNVFKFPVSIQNQIEDCQNHDLLFLSWQISFSSTASESTEEDSDLVGPDITPDSSHTVYTEPQTVVYCLDHMCEG